MRKTTYTEPKHLKDVLVVHVVHQNMLVQLFAPYTPELLNMLAGASAQDPF